MSCFFSSKKANTKNGRQYFLVSVIVLVFSFLFLIQLWQELNYRVTTTLHETFTLEVKRVSQKISERMFGYGLILRSGAGLIAASGSVTRENWLNFIQKLNIDQNPYYQGILGVGFSLLIPKQKLQDHIQEIRNQGLSDYSITPLGDPDTYSRIIYLEPITEGNQPRPGYDMFSETAQQDAMARSRDIGDIALSGKVILSKEIQSDITTDVVAYFPVYRKDSHPQTVEQRRAALIGWVYSPYRMKDLFSPLLENEPPTIRVEIFDGLATTKDALLYESSPDKASSQTDSDNNPFLSSTLTTEFGGRNWTLRYTALPEYAGYLKLQLWLEGAGLTIIGLLLSIVTWVFFKTRSQAEKIAENEKLLIKSLELAQFGSWEWKLPERKATWSDQIYRIFGLSPQLDEITHEDFFRMVHSDDRLRVSASFEKAINKNIPFDINYRIVLPGNIIRIVNDQGELESDASGKPIRLFGLIQDITERKKSEEELQKLWLLLEQSPNCILITNLNAEIEYVNRRFTEETGYGSEEVLGKNPRFLQSGHTDSHLYIEMWEALSHGQIWSGELIDRCKDGREIVVQSKISPVRQTDGTITHYLAILEDVTGKRRAAKELENYRLHLEELVKERTEALVKAMHQAEAANRSKTTFLANMSHEIRTPMNAILGLTHLLQRDIDHPKHAERLNKVDAAAKHLLTIINDILDFSKIEANHLRLEETLLSIPTIIENVYDMMSERAETRHLKIIKEIDANLTNFSLLGDAFRIEQILLNFLSNAIKFTEAGSITMRAIFEAEQEDLISLRFEVEDTGVGLSEENQSRLFDAFEQAETTSTRRHGGTGLGLAISKRLAELMGGKIGVRSQLGNGAIFWFSVGLKRGSNLYQKNDSPLMSQISKGKHILLVEDSVVNQEVTKELLEDKGLLVDIAHHGGEALEKIQVNTYDLVLMDIQMPVMDGLEAARRIRKLPNGQTVPIIAMTANAFDEDRERCLEVGMNAHISKPVIPSLLYTSLANWLASDNAEPKINSDRLNDTINPSDCLICSEVLDMQAGLVYFGGKLPSYRRMLLQFTELHRDAAEELRQLLWVGDRKNAEQIAHTLKSLSATLGGEKVRKIAAELELNSKEGKSLEEISPALDQLGIAIQELCTVIWQLEINASTPTLIEVEPDAFRELIRQLVNQLSTVSPGVQEIWEKAGPLLDEATSSKLVTLIGQRIKASDLSEALILLRELLQEYSLDLD